MNYFDFVSVRISLFRNKLCTDFRSRVDYVCKARQDVTTHNAQQNYHEHRPIDQTGLQPVPGLPEEQQDAIGECTEIVVPVNSGFWI